MPPGKPLGLVDLRERVGILVRHLEEALHAAARVLGPLPVVAVGQEDDEARLAEPLGLARGEELVEDDLWWWFWGVGGLGGG